MKFIHCADVHMGSKMEAKLPKRKAEERRREVADTFRRMVEYAQREGVRAILLCGDVFDSDRPFKRDKEVFYHIIKGCPEIDFLYLRGNHDGRESYTEELANLKLFSGNWSGYDYDNVHIAGLEISPENSLSMYSALSLEEGKKNIVMLHGQVSASVGEERIHVGKFAEKYIDYLALGHIHSYSENKLDDRGRYAYSGCLEGRGFDECGEKGFVLLEVEEEIKSTFIPFAKRKIEEWEVDITGVENTFSAYQLVKEKVTFSPSNLYRIRLIGEVSFDRETLAEDVERYLSDDAYFVSVKDKSLQKIDPRAYAGDLSLKGEFVRSVLERQDWDEERKSKVIALGLKALAGRELMI